MISTSSYTVKLKLFSELGQECRTHFFKLKLSFGLGLGLARIRNRRGGGDATPRKAERDSDGAARAAVLLAGRPIRQCRPGTAHPPG